MQAITTRVLPATNTKPTRIKATSASGLSVTVTELSHPAACRALAKKLGWTGSMVGGGLAGGDMVFVFVDPKATICLDCDHVNQAVTGEGFVGCRDCGRAL